MGQSRTLGSGNTEIRALADIHVADWFDLAPGQQINTLYFALMLFP